MANLAMGTSAKRINVNLADGYVYYDALNWDIPGMNTSQRKNLYRAVKNVMGRIDYDKSKENQVKVLRQMAAAEQKKEIEMLSYALGDKAASVINNPNDFKNYVDAFNLLLNTEKNYAAALKKIKNNDGRVTISSSIYSYIEKAWRDSGDKISRKIFNDINANPTVDPAEVAKDTIIKCLRGDDGYTISYGQASSGKNGTTQGWPGAANCGVIERAAYYMLTAGEDTQADRANGNTPYKDLLDKLNGNSTQKNYFLEQMYEALGIDNIASDIADKINFSTFNRRTVASAAKSKRGLSFSTEKKGSRGTVQEVISEAIINNFSTNVAAKNVVVQANRVGQAEGKADLLITVNINAYPYLQEISKAAASGREENVALYEKIGEKLKQATKGFIIYSNNKNYTLGDSFSGFHSGSDISFETYRNVMKNGIVNADQITGALVQYITGAVYQGQDKKRLVDMISADLAYFLFDDVVDIGRELAVGDGKALHVLNLDDVYLPISLVLSLLADSIEGSEENPNSSFSIARATVKLADGINYIDKVLLNPQKKWTQEDWDKQRISAMQKSTVNITFMQSLSRILQKYM